MVLNGKPPLMLRVVFKSVLALVAAAWLCALAVALCPGSQINFCPGGCENGQIGNGFYACSTDGSNCCQYLMWKQYCLGPGCPAHVLNRTYLATLTNSTCHDPPGTCDRWEGK